jgi:integrase
MSAGARPAATSRRHSAPPAGAPASPTSRRTTVDTWATWHYAANRDLGALQKLGGWKSVAMVMRYAHVNVGELQHTIDRLPGEILGNVISSDTKSA